MNSLQQRFARKSDMLNEDSARDSRNERQRSSRRSDTILSSDEFSIEDNSLEYRPKRRNSYRDNDNTRNSERRSSGRQYSERRNDYSSSSYERNSRPQRFSDDEEKSERGFRNNKENRERGFRDSRNDRGFKENRENRDSRDNRKDEKRFERGSNRRFNEEEGRGKFERGSKRSSFGDRKFGKSDDRFRGDRRNDFNDGDSRRPRPFKKNDRNSRSRQENSQSQHVDDGTIRLNKYIADAGYCSRREADNLISSGCVKVNNVIVSTLGSKINKTDKVQIGDETLHNEKLKYLLLNKPKGYITTMDDPQKRNTVLQLVENACKERLFPVGRLDRNTSGLLMFTNDGELANRLMHPRGNVSKVYHAVLDKPLTKADMEAIANGIELEDGFIAADSIAYSDPNDKKEIGIEIHSGRNHIVRRIFEHLGYDVVKLDRTLYAGLTKKDLPRGRWRFLTPTEVNFLKML